MAAVAADAAVVSMTDFAGSLRERLSIERRGPERDARGAAVGAWIAIGEVMAAMAPDARGPAVAGDAVAGLPLWRVTARAPSPVAVGDRLAWRGRKLAVRWVEADPRLPDRIMIFAEEER